MVPSDLTSSTRCSFLQRGTNPERYAWGYGNASQVDVKFEHLESYHHLLLFAWHSAAQNVILIIQTLLTGLRETWGGGGQKKNFSRNDMSPLTC